MNFENYPARIKDLRYDLDFDCGTKEEKVKQRRLQVINTNMTMTTANKVRFASLNDKRYYFSDGIVSLPFGHPSLKTVREYKKSLSKIHISIVKEKDKILEYENAAVNASKKLRILRSIFSQPIKYFTLKNHRCFLSTKNSNYTTTKQYILNSHWL